MCTDHADLLQEARIGILNAIRTYQPNRGKLSAYAAKKASWAIQHYLRDNAFLIRIPASAQDKKKNIPRVVLDESSISPIGQEMDDLQVLLYSLGQAWEASRPQRNSPHWSKVKMVVNGLIAGHNHSEIAKCIGWSTNYVIFIHNRLKIILEKLLKDSQ